VPPGADEPEPEVHDQGMTTDGFRAAVVTSMVMLVVYATIAVQLLR
jgi:hypothetical protein